MTTPKILMIVTSHDKMGDLDQKTGFWLEEVATPYYIFLDAGAEVTVASPKGGAAPIDPTSAQEDWATDSTRRFNADSAAQKVFQQTTKLADVDASGFDAVFVPGGHGPMWDYPGNGTLKALLEAFAVDEKPLGAVCHGPASLVDLQSADGSPLVKGRRVTAFTDTEEAAVGLAEAVPFLLESKLRTLGATLDKAPDFASHVVRDGFLITGQNPASSGPAASALLEALAK